MTARISRKVAIVEDPFGLPEAPSGMRFAWGPTNTFRYEQDTGIQLNQRAMDLWAAPAVCVAGFTQPEPVQEPPIDYWTFFLLSCIILLAVIIAIAPFALLYTCWR